MQNTPIYNHSKPKKKIKTENHTFNVTIYCLKKLKTSNTIKVRDLDNQLEAVLPVSNLLSVATVGDQV